MRGLKVLFQHVSLPWLRRHPGRSLLLVFSVALGVAAVVASSTLIQSAIASIENTWQATAGRADLRIANGFVGVPEELAEGIRGTAGVAGATSIVTTTARAQIGLEPVDLMMVGIDLLVEDLIHGGSGAYARDRIEVADETDFLVRRNAIAVPRDFAATYGLGLGSTFQADIRTGRAELYVAGLVDPSRISAHFDGALAVMDLPAAQHLLERPGIVDAIDVQIQPNADLGTVEARLAAQLDGRATVTRSGSESPELRSLLFNVRLILGCTGAIATVVGALLIFHVVAFAAAQRKPELDVVRAVGASRRSLLMLLSAEALTLGLAGSAVGIVLGALLARGAAGLFETAVGVLYVPSATSIFQLPVGTMVFAAALGTLLSWVASVPFASRKLRVTSGLRARSSVHERWVRARILAVVGVGAAVFGVLAGQFEWLGMEAETLATVVTLGSALLLLGAGLVAPFALFAVARPLGRFVHWQRDVPLRLAWQSFSSDPARSTVVVISIMVGVAYFLMTVGAVGSLRAAVMGWITETQQSDLIVTAPGSIGFLPSTPAIPAALEAKLLEQPEVAAVEATRLISQPYQDRWIALAARNPDHLGVRQPLVVVSGDLEAARAEMRNGSGAIISEHMALKHELAVGDTFELRSPTGPVSLRTEAIVVDYSGDLGTVIVPIEKYRERWRDSGVSMFNVWLAEDADAAAARDLLSSELGKHYDVSVTMLRDFLADAGAVVDASFYIGYALEAIAVIVMIASVISFFAITLSQRRGELKLLSSLGATRSQIIRVFTWEAAAIGAIGGVLGCASGLYLAMHIVETTMRVGGGMALEFTLPLSGVAIGFGGAVATSVVASLAPVLRATRSRQPTQAEKTGGSPAGLSRGTGRMAWIQNLPGIRAVVLDRGLRRGA